MDAIWARDAANPGLASAYRPKLADALDVAVDTGWGVGQVVPPKVKITREHPQEEYVRTMKIDPAKYYPPGLNRDRVLERPSALDTPRGKIKAKLKEDE
jgi:hypothetical protein